MVRLHSAVWLALLESCAIALPSSDSFHGIARYLSLRSDEQGVILDKSTILDTDLSDITLFKFIDKTATTNGNSATVASKGIDIVCTKCYVLGSARAKMSSKKAFNASEIADSVTDAFNNTFNDIKNYTNALVDEIDDFLPKNLSDFTNLSLDELKGFHLPAPQIDFNVDIDAPDTDLQVEFKDVEVYAELGVALTAGLTYTLNMFSSKELGVQIGNLLVGVVVNLDLILSTQTEIDLNTGFHMKLDRAVMDIKLFAEEASHIDLNGGRFEFLPVTVETTTVILKAVLRVSVRTGFSAGLDFSRPVVFLNRTMDDLKLGAGIEAQVYANIAEFTTNVTAADLSDSPNKCDLSVEQGYQFAIGAAAGASVQLLDHIWGPVPKTEVPLYFTTLTEGCAATRTAAITTAVPTLQARDDLVATSTVSEITYSALACASPGLINCPASLLSLSTNIITTTLSTNVASGSSVVWDAKQTVQAVPFGTNVVTLAPSSGKPISFVPQPTSKAHKSAEDVVQGSTSGVSNKLIIGLSVGLGVPALLVIIATIIFCRRKSRRSNAVNSKGGMEQTNKQASPTAGSADQRSQ